MNTTVSIAIRPNLEKKADHRAKMQKIAEEIISPTPPWLSKCLFNWSFDFVSADSIEKISPTRKNMRQELVKIHQLSDLLERHLQNSAVIGFIEVNSDADFHAEVSSVRGNLNRLRSQVRQALKSPQLIGENGKVLSGRGKPLLPNTMPPRYVCAAIIAEVFDFFYPDKDANPPQRKVWSAAEEFWESFFEPEGWGNDGLTGWKDYFKAANDSRLQSLRSGVRRILSIEAHHYALCAEENTSPNPPINLG